MMLIEIALMIAVWRRGWKVWALLPFGITMGVSFFTGVILAANGHTEINNPAPFLVFDFILIAVLLVMYNKKPQRIKKNETQNERAQLPVPEAVEEAA